MIIVRQAVAAVCERGQGRQEIIAPERTGTERRIDDRERGIGRFRIITFGPYVHKQSKRRKGIRVDNEIELLALGSRIALEAQGVGD